MRACPLIGFVMLYAASMSQATELERWARDLGDDNYRTRQESTANLASAGEPAIEVLFRVWREGGFESRWRARLALQRIGNKDAALKSKILTLANREKLLKLARALSPQRAPVYAPQAYPSYRVHGGVLRVMEGGVSVPDGGISIF